MLKKPWGLKLSWKHAGFLLMAVGLETEKQGFPCGLLHFLTLEKF